MEESVSRLREVLTCVVCLDTLVPPVVQCQRGHAICGRCQQGQHQCPSCRRRFLPDKPTLLCQLLEVVSDRCKFAGCRQVLEGGEEDHRTWCEFRPTRCKLCPWSGSSRTVYDHVLHAHRDCAVIGPAGNVADQFFSCLHSGRSYVPFSTNNLFFWIQLKTWNLSWQSSSNLLAVKFILVPNRKIPNDFYIKVRFHSENCETTVRKRLEIDPKENSEKNCVFIPELVLDGRNDFLSVDVVQECQPGAPTRNTSPTQYLIQQAFQTFLQAIERKINLLIADYRFDYDNYSERMKIFFFVILCFYLYCVV